jgi:ankyrin repeat protein
LIHAEADLDHKDEKSETALHKATRHGSHNCVELLLHHGVYVNAQNSEGRTALHLASEAGSYKICDVLIKNGANVNMSTNYFGSQALHAASIQGTMAYALVKLLLDSGANVDAKDKNGDTPLIWAARYRCEAIVKLLLDRGANIDAEAEDGCTPLISAVPSYHRIAGVIYGDVEKAPPEPVIKLLLDRGANINAKNNRGCTTLILAVHMSEDLYEYPRRPLEFMFKSVIKLLLDQGADTKVRDTNGRTALDIAKREKGHALIELLQQYE